MALTFVEKGRNELIANFFENSCAELKSSAILTGSAGKNR